MTNVTSASNDDMYTARYQCPQYRLDCSLLQLTVTQQYFATSLITLLLLTQKCPDIQSHYPDHLLIKIYPYYMTQGVPSPVAPSVIPSVTALSPSRYGVRLTVRRLRPF